MGLYFRTSIVLFYIPIVVIYLIKRNIGKKVKKFYFLSPKRYLKYLKLVINNKCMILIILASIIANSIVIYQNNKYESLYKNMAEIEGEAIVISVKKEKEYTNLYKIKMKYLNNSKKYQDTCLYLKVDKKKSIDLQYGDKIKVKGEFIEPEVSRNYGGFNYKEYLKSLQIYGTIKASNIEVRERDKGNLISKLSNFIYLKIEKNIDNLFETDVSGIIKGIVLGDKNNIDEDIQEKFRISGISHILAVSGMHVSYLILSINIIFKNRFGKRNTKFIIIILLFFYMFLTGFSPSIVRASIMGIILLSSGLFHRRNDVVTSISLSLLSSLIYNPFLIENIGLQFSFIATIGIILLQKNIKRVIKNIKVKNKKRKDRLSIKSLKFISKLQEFLAVTISAQISILPIMIYHFNMFGTYFIVTNLFVSIIIGPTLIVSVIIIIFSFIFNPVAKVISYFLSFLIYILIYISNISNIPFSKLYLPTPNDWSIILYYIIVLLVNIIYFLYNNKKTNSTIIRFRNIIALIKYKLFLNRKRYLKLIIILILILFFLKFIPKNLQINFVDVGQGDCTFIVTPFGKTILIDGGGSRSNEFDVGKSTLLPYVLDKGYTRVDYMIISHFDQDHVGGLLTILEELSVNQVIISKQGKDSENYQKFLKIVKEKNINVLEVKKGDVLAVEKELRIYILWPKDEQIQENILNNNSIVAKLIYKNFSMLLTGDIEEVAENEIIKEYKGKTDLLKATILKVPHHGSKTSSTQEFLEVVNPKFALIGVGKNNTFGHPNDEVIERIKDLRHKSL